VLAVSGAKTRYFLCFPILIKPAEVYNRTSTRLKNPQDAAERALKAREVQTLISGDGESQASLKESFFYKYKKAFGSGPAVTFYVHTHTMQAPDAAHPRYPSRYHDLERPGARALQQTEEGSGAANQ
jgi:hypothetical protein